MQHWWKIFVIVFIIFLGTIIGLFNQHQMYGAGIRDSVSTYSLFSFYFLIVILFVLMIIKIREEKKDEKNN